LDQLGISGKPVIKVLRESEEIEDKVTVKEVAYQGLKEGIEVEIWLHIKVEVQGRGRDY
jgi:hypothetical protein